MSLLLNEPAVAAQSAPTVAAKRSRLYPWAVFTLTFALLLSDYMSRQVLSSVFPYLKHEWHLTDTKLGGLTSVVAFTVGLLAVPLSLIGDRFGRVKAIVGMAVLWSIATAGCAVAANYDQMMLARVFIGVGEAAYGSVGLAVVLAVFPRTSRASLSGAFIAGGSFGSVLGIVLGGKIAGHFGWRWAFGTMAIVGLVIAALYVVVVNEKRLARNEHPDTTADKTLRTSTGKRVKLRSLVSTPAVVLAYLGSGLQLFVAGSLFAWLPTYFFRTYKMTPPHAASRAAIFILIMGVGMVACGYVTDKLSRNTPVRKWTTSIVFGIASLVFLGIGFRAHAGNHQLQLLAVGVFFAAGVAGPAGAMVANLTHESIRSSALGTLTFANNLLGLASGPLLTGVLADHYGLARALQIVPLISVVSLAALTAGRHFYPSSLKRVNAA
jgi:MFS family permease